MSSILDAPAFRQLLDDYSGNAEEMPLVLALYRNPHRQQELDYIDAVFERLPEGRVKKRIQREFLSEDPAHHWGAWYELMVYDWLDRLNKNPQLERPLPGGSTPDIKIQSGPLDIFIEVTHVRESLGDQDIETSWWNADTATFARMTAALKEKSVQHPTISPSAAYVICIALENKLIEMSEVKTALFGHEQYSLTTSKTRIDCEGLLFENHPDALLVKHRNVSAFLVTKRDQSTLGAFKLRFGLIQNPYAQVPIPNTEFGNIKRWVPVECDDGTIGMKFVPGVD
jgi:hypothetical protein